MSKISPSVFGNEPQYVDLEVGLLEQERILIDLSLLPPDLKLGILTGRARRETALALERIGLSERIPPEFWVTDDDAPRKPDPRALALLTERLKTRCALYVGDTIDDLRMVNEYKLRPHRRAVFACMVLTGPNGEKNRPLFLEQGADIVATDINALLGYLRHVRKG